MVVYVGKPNRNDCLSLGLSATVVMVLRIRNLNTPVPPGRSNSFVWERYCLPLLGISILISVTALSDLPSVLTAVGVWGSQWRFSVGIGPDKTVVSCRGFARDKLQVPPSGRMYGQASGVPSPPPPPQWYGLVWGGGGAGVC